MSTTLSLVHHLVGVEEIRELLPSSRSDDGLVVRQRVDQLTRKSDFPRPVVVLHSGRVWRRIEVERWLRRKGYPIELEGR
ncbi:MAG: hypothetical protein WCF24_02575 [Acidimicrobiales bacterium]